MSTIAGTINTATTGNLATALAASQARRTPGNSLGQADFLQLMTAQVTAQDPFKPLDQTQMVAQLAQFSQVAGTAEMNASLGQIAEQMRTQGALLADIRTALSSEPTLSPTPTTGV
jgi:flagellar basal-body rod modification protein FlgD